MIGVTEKGSSSSYQPLPIAIHFMNGISDANPTKIFFKDIRFSLESLILAQNERWRRALHMQVERESSSE